MKVLRVLALAGLVVAMASPVAAQERLVWDFVGFSITPTMTDAGPPTAVDFLAQATTSVSASGQNYPVYFWLSVYNQPFTTGTGSWQTDYRDTPGSPLFSANFSFTLPNSTDDWYYWGYASYYSTFVGTYFTSDGGGPLAFQERVIPTLSTWGLALLGMLVAAGGVLLLRRH